MKRLATLVLVVAIAGCAGKLPTPRGAPVTGGALKKLLTNATVHGRSTRVEEGFVERYYPDGRYSVAFTKNRYQHGYGNKHEGTWRLEGDRVCYKVASLNSDGCVIIYSKYDQIEFVSPETGKVASFSYEIYFGEKESPPKIATAPPAAPDTPTTTPTPVPSLPSPPKVATTPPTPPNPQPQENLTLIASGSGFIVSSQTYVLTNEHVIEKCAEVTVRIDGLDIPATVTARDRRNDLALLRLPAGKYPVVFFRGNDGLYPGDSVVAIGYPLSDLLASEGNVSIGIVSALSGIGNDASLLQVSTPVQPGNSGGPLFDMSENVVGVIVAGLGKKFFETDGTLPQNVNFAIKSAVAKAFMQASGVEYQSRKSTKELRPADVARKGRPATVYIKCWG